MSGEKVENWDIIVKSVTFCEIRFGVYVLELEDVSLNRKKYKAQYCNE